MRTSTKPTVSDARRSVDKVWSFCNLLRDGGVSTIECTEQLTYVLFLKMAHERATRGVGAPAGNAASTKRCWRG